jgi:hypothetical protein
MPQLKTSASERARREKDAPIFLRWYAPLTAALNVILLLQVVNRFHHAITPINHGLARVLTAALIVNLATAGAMVWLVLGRGWKCRVASFAKIDLLTALLPFVMSALRDGDKDSVFRTFALIYIIFLLLKMVALLMFAAANADDAGSLAHLPAIVFAAAFIVYGGTVPWMALASPPMGDEAHFMILTHSLVFDHDFDVGNNYKNGDYKEEFPTPSPGSMRGYPYAFIQRDGIEYLPHEPHVVRNFRGQLMLEHDMGLPLLLVPGYALDLREGALFTISLIAALGAAGIFQLAVLLGASYKQAFITVALFCFTCPFLTFTQAAFSDVVGASGSVWIALQFFRYRRREYNGYLLLSGILISLLPWLNIRFWSLAGPSFLLINAWVIRREWGKWSRLISKMALLGVPSLVSIALYSYIDKVLFDRFMPNVSMVLFNHIQPQFGSQPIRGFLGILFDQSNGLLPVAPLYVAAAAGMFVLFRRDRWGFFALALPAVGYVPFLSSSQFWSGGWCAPGRLVMSAVLPMAACAALVLNRKTRWIVAILAVWSFFVAILFTVNPFLRMPSVFNLYKVSMLVEFLHDHIHTPLYSILSIYPGMIRASKSDYLLGFFWLAVFTGAAWAWSRTANNQSASQRHTRS